MLNIFDETVIVNKAVQGKLIRPSQPCFVLIQDGHMVLEVNSISTRYQSLDLILLSPLKLYRLIHCSENIRAYFVLYDRDMLKGRINVTFNKFSLIQLMNLTQDKDTYSLSVETFMHFWNTTKLLRAFINDASDSKFNDQIIIHSFTVIVYMFADILMKNSPLAIVHTTRKEAIAMDFIHLVSEHFKEERKLKFYADKLFISIKYLSICVKEVTGISPQALIANTLMDEAKLLLINTELNIIVIADLLSFSDQYAFGKFFKKHAGVSPRNFRRNIVETHTI